MRVLSRPDWAWDSSMERIAYTTEQINLKITTTKLLIDQFNSIPDICRLFEVGQLTCYRWRQQYGGRARA
jgi:transposase-like protein